MPAPLCPTDARLPPQILPAELAFTCARLLLVTHVDLLPEAQHRRRLSRKAQLRAQGAGALLTRRKQQRASRSGLRLPGLLGPGRRAVPRRRRPAGATRPHSAPGAVVVAGPLRALGPERVREPLGSTFREPHGRQRRARVARPPRTASHRTRSPRPDRFRPPGAARRLRARAGRRAVREPLAVGPHRAARTRPRHEPRRRSRLRRRRSCRRSRTCSASSSRGKASISTVRPRLRGRRFHPRPRRPGRLQHRASIATPLAHRATEPPRDPLAAESEHGETAPLQSLPLLLAAVVAEHQLPFARAGTTRQRLSLRYRGREAVAALLSTNVRCAGVLP